MILNVRLKDMLNVDKWQRIQDAIAEETGLAVVTCDYKGKPVTAFSNMPAFCEAVRNNQEAVKLCERCASIGGYEAFRCGEPFGFRCHMGLSNVAVPLIADDNYLGYVIAGGVRPAPGSERDLEESCRSSNVGDYFPEAGHELEAKMPVFSSDDLKKRVKFIEAIADYVVSEKYDLILEKEKNAKRQLTHAVVKSDEPAEEPEDPKYMVNILFPAFDYIAIHFRESISLQFIADLCHVSPSYFSRMFAKETRESFSTYIMKLRISYAKQQISTTEKSIAEIGFDSGFGDSSHFIKSFKKIEGITPLQYRKKML